MPCYFPLQATFSVRSDGKKDIQFSNALARAFVAGVAFIKSDNLLSLPCGRCIGCRLERSRQWAVRIMHEAEMHSQNCFVTLTFDDKHLAEMCPTGSLSRSHPQKFMRRLRKQFSDRRIRFYYCGEYGEQLTRPHYHACLFNCDFPDKLLFTVRNGFKYYTSDVLAKCWPFGHSLISDLTFESAAYVARYCLKKITGQPAEAHYQGRLPEFGQASLKPGIGSGWLGRFGSSDVWSFDEVVVRGKKCSVPRYYDKCLQRDDPVLFAELKKAREEAALLLEADNSHARLIVKEKCTKARVREAVRSYERD